MAKPKKFAFNVEKYLQTAGLARKVVEYRKRQTIFAQGSACQSVLYLQRGRVKLTVTSDVGREAVIAVLTDGEFFGEGCIAGQPLRTATAVAMEPTSVLEIGKQEMIRVIHNESKFSDRFVAHMLKRNVRIEEDLTDQLFNSSEKRLARTLLLVARYGKEEQPEKIIAKISQETLAEMIGTTRSRVSFFITNSEGWATSNTTTGCKSTVRCCVSCFANRSLPQITAERDDSLRRGQ